MYEEKWDLEIIKRANLVDSELNRVVENHQQTKQIRLNTPKHL